MEVMVVRVEGEGLMRKLRVEVERAVVVLVSAVSCWESFSRRTAVSLMGGVALLAMHHAVSVARDCRTQG